MWQTLIFYGNFSDTFVHDPRSNFYKLAGGAQEWRLRWGGNLVRLGLLEPRYTGSGISAESDFSNSCAAAHAFERPVLTRVPM